MEIPGNSKCHFESLISFKSIPSWCQMSWWTFRFTLTHNTELSIYQDIILNEKLSTLQNLQYLKQSLGEIPGETVNCYPQSDTSDGIEQLASLFLILYLILCSQWSASGKPWSRRCSRGYRWFFYFTFLLLNQEHSVNNERWQSIQTVRHSKQTHCMWPRQKDRSTQKKRIASSTERHLAVQYSRGPCLKVWYGHRPALFDCHLHSEIMEYGPLPVVCVWNYVLPQGLHSSRLSPLLFLEIN